MKSSQVKGKGLIGHWSSVIDGRRKDRRCPSITLGLLTTVLGMTGILRAANANELPERLNIGLSDEVTGQTQTEDVRRSHTESLGKTGETQDSPLGKFSLVPNLSSATANLEATQKTTPLEVPGAESPAG
jgi:hypothetical protein